MIYLDYAANTPVNKKVLEKFNEVTLKFCGNPNSAHNAGKEAKKVVDKASLKIAKIFNTQKESIIYTSGSSESNNMVIKGLADRLSEKGKHIIISSVEHSSIIAPCNYLASKGYEISIIPLESSGKVDLEVLKKSIRKDTILISICAVDSELGTIQPIEEIAKIAKEKDIIFHSDATQAIGKASIDYSDVDFITFAPHKFFGLNGMGVLINKNDIKFTPLIHGGKSTTIYRSGTPVPSNAASISVALKQITKNFDKNNNHLKELKKYLIDNLNKLDYVHINSPKESIPSTINFSLININSDKVVENLFKKDICVSKQSACSLGSAPSKSVMAITKDENLARNSIRVSMSYLTTKKELDTFLKELKKACED